MAKNKIKLNKNLFLFNFILKEFFNNNSIAKLTEVNLNNVDYEGYTEENQSRFINQIIGNLGLYNDDFKNKLLKYDSNIYQHTKHINQDRKEKIVFKYFQYIALLFTEIYLDKYFSNKKQLLTDLNNYLRKEISKEKNQKQFEVDLQESDLYKEEDLKKLVFYMATGSGKTLLLHINLLQINHYINKYHLTNKYNSTFYIVTPNEGLTNQHIKELEDSSLNASNLESGQIKSNNLYNIDNDLTIKVFDIHKLKDKEGDKTIAVESLGKDNIVFIDEGHRGNSSEAKRWKIYREKLFENGFGFEYSATFGQAIKYNKNNKTDFLKYAKSIIFDYSYKFFYNDGYGKEFNIVNIKKEKIEKQTNLYLIANFLLFIQQLIIFHDNKEKLKDFNIYEPLMIFVGNKVSATSSSQTKSDIARILVFLDYFTKPENKETLLDQIKDILKGESGLKYEDKNQEVYYEKLTFLRKNYLSNIEDLYNKTLKLFFNSQNSGNLNVINFKGQEGEIGLKLANAAEPFGLINIGDTTKFIKHIAEKTKVKVSPSQNINISYFKNINKKIIYT